MQPAVVSVPPQRGRAWGVRAAGSGGGSACATRWGQGGRRGRHMLVRVSVEVLGGGPIPPQHGGASTFWLG